MNMKKLIIIAFAILILASAFQVAKIAPAAAATMNLSGAWDILLFYNDGGVDREIWYLTQEGNTITGHSRYLTDRGDFIRNRMTGLINGSYLTMTIKTGQDYVTEFKARIGDNGATMGTESTSPNGTSFKQTLININADRSYKYSDRQDRWLNMNGQWWGQKQTNPATMDEPYEYQSNSTQYQYPTNYQTNFQASQSYENYPQSYSYNKDLDLTGAWDILLFYDNGGVNREIWFLNQNGSLLTGHTRYRNDAGSVVRSRLTGRLNGSNLTMSVKTGDYNTQFQARITDNGLRMGTKKVAPDGSSFNQTMRNIDSGTTTTEMTVPNRYQNGDWWGQKRDQQSSR
ncbi:MAG: hypothetical protein RDV48_30065 [Candidatus Eremiobacteraeota bacterium]|nr:hypothetical protein [Candidatus Eremiobacteraeota bacterium]